MQIFKEKSPPEVTWLVFLETFTTITVTPKDSPPIATSCALLGGWIWECQEPFRPRRTFPLSSTSLSFSHRALPTPNPLFFFGSSTFPVRSCLVPFTPAPSSPEPERGEHAWTGNGASTGKNIKEQGGGGWFTGGIVRKKCGWKSASRYKRKRSSYLWLGLLRHPCFVCCSFEISWRSSQPI